MADRKDIEDLARRFLDLWQDQVTAMAQDPDAAAAARRWMSIWMTGDWVTGFRDGGDEPASDASGTETAAAASRSRDPDLDELAGRVRELEERIAALERGKRGTGRTPGKRPRGADRSGQSG